MPITALDHVQLAMPPGEGAAAIAFYEALLGIPHVPKPPHLAVRGGCWFESDEVKVHLGVEQDFRPARQAHPALRVQGLADLLATLRAAASGSSTTNPSKATTAPTSTTPSTTE